MKPTPKPTRRGRVRGSTETFEVEYSQDPQVHQDALNDPNSNVSDMKPEAAESSAVAVSRHPVEMPGPKDAALNEPMTYVVSPVEATERAAILLEKVKDARPDLAEAVDAVLTQVDGLDAQVTGRETAEAVEVPAIAPSPAEGPKLAGPQGGVQPQPGGTPQPSGAPQPGMAATGPGPGDRVQLETKEGKFNGVVEDVNQDGTLEILTDKNMKLSHVPADSVQVEQEGAAGSMALPAGIRSSRRQDVGKDLKAPLKGMGAGDKPAAAAVEAAAKTPKAELAVKAARQQFMAGTLDLNLLAAYHPAAQAEVRRLLADKTLKFAASAFEKLESLDLGGGMTARRAKKDKDEEVATVVVTDKEGKEVGKYPDAFGDDTVSIIKLFRQLLDIKESDDKAAAKAEGSEAGGESKKPLALPKTEEPKKKSEKEAEEKEELVAAEKKFEQRLQLVRDIVADRVAKRYVVAQQEDIDGLLRKKMGLEASMNEALKMAVDRDIMRLLAMPDAELPSIRASLGSLPPRPTQVETKASNEGLPLLRTVQLYAEKAEEDGLGISAAFGSAYRR